MRKLLSFAMAGFCLCGIVACEDSFENPGDFNVKSTLEFAPASALSKVDGITYEFKVREEKDTAFVSFYTKNDTTKDASGNPVIGSDGKLEIKTDTIYFKTGKVAHYYEMDTITLPSYADTFTVHITVLRSMAVATDISISEPSETRRSHVSRRLTSISSHPTLP